MIRTLLIVAVTSVTLLGCEKRIPEPQPPVTADDVTQRMSDAAANCTAVVQQEIDQLKQKLGQGKTRAAKVGTTAKAALNRQAEFLGEKWSTAERKLSELKSSGNDRWQHFKDGVDEVVGDLKRSLARSKNRR